MQVEKVLQGLKNIASEQNDLVYILENRNFCKEIGMTFPNILQRLFYAPLQK